MLNLLIFEVDLKDSSRTKLAGGSFNRKLASTKATDNAGLKCAIDHIVEAQQKGEISEDNVLYIIENINVAGIPLLPESPLKLAQINPRTFNEDFRQNMLDSFVNKLVSNLIKDARTCICLVKFLRVG